MFNDVCLKSQITKLKRYIETYLVTLCTHAKMIKINI